MNIINPANYPKSPSFIRNKPKYQKKLKIFPPVGSQMQLRETCIKFKIQQDKIKDNFTPPKKKKIHAFINRNTSEDENSLTNS